MDQLKKIRDILEKEEIADIIAEYENGDNEYSDEYDDILMLIVKMRQREAKLKYEYEYAKNVVDMMEEGIATVSESNKIVFANNIFIEFFQLKDIDLNTPIDKIQELAEIAEIIIKNSKIDIREKEIVLDGEKTIVSIKIKTMKGILADKIVMIKDITDDVRMKDIVLETKKIIALGDFASGIAHEIRNPLTPVKGLLQIIKGNLKGKNDSFDKYMSVIFSEIDKIDLKIQSLAKFAEKTDYIKNAKPLSEIVLDAEKVLETEKCFKENRVFIYNKFNHQDDLVHVNIDRMTEAVVNVLINCAESFRSDSGRENKIEVRTFNEKGKLVLEIKDNGKGMSRKVLRNAINPFYTTKEGNAGMGLGLPIAYKIINDHNATMMINSDEGIGTIIRISFYL